MFWKPDLIRWRSRCTDHICCAQAVHHSTANSLFTDLPVPTSCHEQTCSKTSKMPKRAPVTESPSGWALDKEAEQSSCWALPGATTTGTSAPGRQINQITMQAIKKEQFPHSSGASSPEKEVIPVTTDAWRNKSWHKYTKLFPNCYLSV